MLKHKINFFQDLRGLGVIERNYSFLTRNFQITLNCNLYNTVNLIKDLLEIETDQKLKRLGRLLLLRFQRLAGAWGFDHHVLRVDLEFYPCPF